MVGSLCEIGSDKRVSWTLKETLFEIVRTGCTTFCVCSGSRNSAIISYLEAGKQFTLYTWPEERSAAFFALGLSRRLGTPVAVVTTSGTAVAELLPATIEAFYTGTPLILLTADRPKSYRGSGAPQTIEQKDIFGCYAKTVFDLEEGESFSLEEWNQKSPCHINLCLGEPKPFVVESFDISVNRYLPKKNNSSCALDSFFKQSKKPLVLVSGLPSSRRALVKEFLLQLKAPVLLEGTSGLREDLELAPLRYDRSYLYDGVLRIGSIPTTRLWRDLEDLKLPVISVSDLPFSGLSHGESALGFESLERVPPSFLYQTNSFSEQAYNESDEVSLMHKLSSIIPTDSLIYLGNSMPIRNWDVAATRSVPHPHVFASRGANGIDGQLSTFFGLCERGRPNVALIGDLTALYDLAGFWILKQLDIENITIVIINNGGGQIFAKMFPQKSLLNEHSLNFKPIADFWGLEYTLFQGGVPMEFDFSGRRLIEVIPG